MQESDSAYMIRKRVVKRSPFSVTAIILADSEFAKRILQSNLFDLLIAKRFTFLLVGCFFLYYDKKVRNGSVVGNR